MKMIPHLTSIPVDPAFVSLSLLPPWPTDSPPKLSTHLPTRQGRLSTWAGKTSYP